MKPVRIGCSGWNYSDWKGSFYPEDLPASRSLEHYATQFDTVEVNATFYRLPTIKSVTGWLEAVPEGFELSIKASRYLTHVKRLRDLPSGIDRFAERLEPMLGSSKMGPVLWQLPENFQRDDERLAEALEALPDWRHCFELRHPSWFCDDVMAMLREHGVALVIGDHPERPFQSHELTTDWTYIRLHYGSRGHRGNYSEAELETWKRRIASWRSRAEVYVYFNNDWEAFAPRNAAWLRDHLGAGAKT